MSDMMETSVKRKATVWIGVVFLLGAALGGMVAYAFARHSAMAAPGQMTWTERRAQRVQRMTQELNLTAQQQKQLDEITANMQSEFKAIHKSVEPQMDQVRQKGREQIRAILTPEQKPKFEEFMKRIDEERKRNTGR